MRPVKFFSMRKFRCVIAWDEEGLRGGVAAAGSKDGFSVRRGLEVSTDRLARAGHGTGGVMVMRVPLVQDYDRMQQILYCATSVVAANPGIANRVLIEIEEGRHEGVAPDVEVVQ